MAKKWLSMILSIAMLLSCISGITLFTAAAAEPYAWFDTADGECTYDGVAVQEVYYDWEDPVAEEYGVRLSDGGKFVFGGELLAGVPAEQSVTLVLKYYIDGDITGTMFSYRIGDGNGEVGMAEDVAVTADDLVKNEVGTLYITLTEEDKAIATVEGDYFYVYVTGGADCADSVYIQSAKVVDTACDAMDDADAFHAYMLANELNTKLVGVRDATDFEEGYTGDVKCVTCDATLKAGEPIPATSDLPTPYAWLDTNGGVLTTNRTVSATGESGSLDVLPIPGTDEYGIRLNGDWSGFWLDAAFANDVPAGKSVTMVVEYYVDKDFVPTDGNQMFRYQAYPGWQGGNSAPDGNAWTNIYTTGLSGKQDAVFYYTFTEADRAAIGDGAACFAVVGCSWGANAVYIKSMRLVDTAYVNVANDTAYAYIDFTEQAVCEYYPDIKATTSKDVTLMVQDRWNFALSGAVLAADKTQNKPVYIRVKMKDTWPHASVDLDQFERYGGEGVERWAYNNTAWAEREQYRTISLTDGVGGILLPETSFTNGNNGGSLRIGMDAAPHLERIEFYDVQTFCKDANATADGIAEIHAVLLNNNVNIEKVGREEATEEKEGYTGDTVCLTCGTVLAEGVTIPMIDPNRPLASLDTAGGTLTLNGCTVSAQGNGNTDVVAIGDTGEYGIKLPADWHGFNMENLSLVGAAGDVAMLIEYYTDKAMDDNWRMFRYKINDRNHVDVMGATHSLVSGKSGLVYHIFTEAELAAIGDNSFIFRLMACDVGADVTYIQSVKLVSADVLDIETDAGYGYIDFTPQAITPVYPEALIPPTYLMGYADMEKSAESPDRDWLYRYITVSGDLLAQNNASRPVYIKLYAAEGYENDTVTIGAVECTAGVFGNDAVVQMTDGVGGVFLPAATFTNGLNGIASLRMRWEEAAKIRRIEILNSAEYCGRDDADAALVTQFHEGFLSNRVNVNLVGKLDPTEEEEGYTGDVYCATCNTKLQDGTSVPKLEASDLPAPYAYFDTTNGTLKVGGTTLTNQGVNPVPLPIGGSGEYGIKLTGDWQGFGMQGMSLPTDKELTVVIEYYVDDPLPHSMQLFRYQAYANMPGETLPDGSDSHWNDIFSDLDNIKSRQSALLTYTLTPEAVAAINSGDIFSIRGCAAGTNVAYIQSVRIIDSAYMAGGTDPGYDYIRFEEEPLCAYYPDITGVPSAGITVIQTHEGDDPENGEAIRYAYFKVTRALAAEGQIFRPVVIRFTFKENSTIEQFDWQYQGARRADPPNGSEWSHQSSAVQDGVVEVVLHTACFANELNGLGSFRVSNRASNAILDNLLMVEVVALADMSALQALVDGVEDAVVGKTRASADAYRALVAEKAALLEDMWTTDEDVAAAVAEIEAAAARMVDCLHDGETKLVGATAVSGHVVPGYTGDVCCAECNALLEEGEVIPAHETEIRNIKEPTCKEPGNTGDRWCLDCDELVTAGKAIMQLPHEWDEGVVTKPATPAEKGELTVTCTVCGDTKITRLDFKAGLGDVDENGKVDSTDARLVLQFAVKKIAPSALNLKVADVDGNGKVDSTDARLVLQYAVKKITKFPTSA
ncbi:MAG: hypothetical protein E7549_05145 [Ruminococcaceae bacterium]|nr:hypothetical protein [Oscillospiraceae bacterium]